MKFRLPPLMEVVRRCPYCKRESTVDPLSYAENRFCNDCLAERMAESAARERPLVGWVPEGHYARPVRVPERFDHREE